MPIYNKLVRDRIPEVIENTGKTFSTRILSNSEYITELNKKAFEELEEFVSTETVEDAVEELADLLEIIHAFAEYHGVSIEQVEEVRKTKAEKRGGFKEKIFLIEVEDEQD
ncbi:nucleoside triphosphate pyrophosphohydrolase [Bacillus sp. T33-2]|uniref:nucleoside triphosphate pyrophosphohydrolase n=1 Tax=Bacillus sp. T33-2 TaxID=2054168 RepID=UPI000C75D2D1|nr:nucleoside triphosphate pyrophosphohydrolase [Bacillus sp. T33-2]PLR92044.1 phosphoribosyl-ATP pyrophosphohydrolase [Bacillus sp. T33-2]